MTAEVSVSRLLVDGNYHVVVTATVPATTETYGEPVLEALEALSAELGVSGVGPFVDGRGAAELLGMPYETFRTYRAREPRFDLGGPDEVFGRSGVWLVSRVLAFRERWEGREDMRQFNGKQSP